MALSFQNAESIKQALFEELQNVLNPDKEIRNNAEKRISQLVFTEGYAVYLAEIIMNQSYNISFRQLACIMLTKYVEEHWDSSGESDSYSVSDQVKKAVKNILPNGLYDQNSKIRSAVAHTISEIAIHDWPQNWTELFDIIIKCLGGNDNSISGALLVLHELEYDEPEIKQFGPIIIQEVYKIFDSEPSTCSDKTRAYSIRLLKTLLVVISVKVSNKEEKNSMMNLILSNFMEKLLQNLSINNTGPSYQFIIKTEILNLLTFADTDMSKNLQPYIDQILPSIWQLLTQTADAYVKIIVNETEPNPFVSCNDDDEELSNFTCLITQILQFVQCVSRRKFRFFIKNVLTDLIYIMIVYMQISEEQIESWNDDAEKFVEDEDDNGGDLAIRSSAQDVLTTLSTEFGDEVLKSLSEALARHFNVAEAEKTSGNRHWWKIYEASMSAVIIFKDLILENEGQFDLLNYLTMVRNFLNEDTSPYLRGRGLCTLSEFSQSKVFNIQMLGDVLEISQSSLAVDKPIALKIGAVRTIYGFVTNMHKSSDLSEDRRILILSKLEGYVNGIIAIMGQTKCGVLALLLEALTTIISFDNNFAATVQAKVIPLTIAILLKYHDDPYVLELVQDMLKALSQNPLCLQPLQVKLIPTLVSILNLQGEHANSSMQDIALDVLSTLVKYSQPPLSENLIENAFPAAIHCILRSDDYTIMSSGGECLRTFIYVSPEQVCAYKNGEGLNYILQVTTMLLNPMNSEFTASQIGRLMITIIMKIGNMLGEHIDLLLKAVISKMQLVESFRVTMSLVTTFAHLFLTQMEAALNFLSTVPGPTGEPAINFVFTNWLSRQQMFFGSYERKVTTMALCKLIEYGVTSQDTRLTSITIKDLVENSSSKMRTRSQTANSNVWVDIPVLIKMFKLIIHELRVFVELADEESSISNSDDEENPLVAEAAGGDSGKGESSQKIRRVSDLFFTDEDENAEDDPLMQELMKDPIFQVKLEDILIKFIQNFSKNEHFPVFVEHLTKEEKDLLNTLEINVH